MQEIKKYDPGMFCWIDLVTIDTEAAKKFYCSLFGWEALDTPVGDGMVYTMLQLNGKPVAALYQMGEFQKQQNLEPYWMSYVSVQNADETMKKVQELGGQVVMEPGDAMDAGRMAMLKDPTGAFLAIWQPKAHIGASYRNVPGTFCWIELATNDPEKAKPFFTKLFNWTEETRQMGNTVYTTFKLDGKDVGGMYKMPPEMAAIPPHWLPYFQVNDCQASVKKVQSLGGKLLVPVTVVPGVGPFSVIEDPQAGVFGVVS
ncbi:VOC family protein [candidate division KSB1 bacterium]|nr:VOC family protein [candidate division KSB1 bacterium]